ncbi:MAG: CotH kinase family protein, partial [Lachnospiraceae bacterium]|nr:CotH kinase family protein [Lachnospiraceae bacterium]
MKDRRMWIEIVILILVFIVGVICWMILVKESIPKAGNPYADGIGDGGFSVPASPMPSAEPGFYDHPFHLELTSAPGTTVYYTTDGSIPDESSMRYTEPIYIYDRSPEDNIYRSIPNTSLDWFNDPIDTTPVEKGYVIRAVAISDMTGNLSETVTATYFVGRGNQTGRSVVSLVADPPDLFGDDGIYVTGAEYDEWYGGDQEGDAPAANFEVHGLECPASFEFYRDGVRVTDQKVGIRVRGHSNRDHKIKQFSVYSRKQYGTGKVFDYEFFEDKKTHSVALRWGFENAVMMYLGEGRDVSYFQSFPVDVFLNGEYWYSCYLQEKCSETFFRDLYGVRGAEIFKASFPQEILDYVEREDMSDPDVYSQVCDMIDMQSYIDYSCINVYIANSDYCIETSDNSVCWRSSVTGDSPYDDGRLRWCLYDLDRCADNCRAEWGLTETTDAQLDSFNIMLDWAPSVHDSLLFSNFKENPDFCRQYVNTFMDMVNTTFTVEHMSELLTEWGRDISFDDNFFADRAGYITGYLEQEFGITGSKE